MNKLRKQSDTTYPLFFLMVDSTDHVTGKTGLSPTVTISKNGGSFASPSGAVSEVGNGLYKVAGNATDSNTVGELWIHATGTGADPTDTSYTIVAYDPFGMLDATAARAAVGLASPNLDTQLSAIDDYIDTEISAIKTKTDFLPSATPGSAGGLFIAGVNAATSITSGLTANIIGNLTGNVSGSVNGVTGNVTGSVGSVVGHISGNLLGTINGLTATALKNFFDTDSTTTYASAVAGSVVKEISSGSGTYSVADIADAVWDETVAGHGTAGTFGQSLAPLNCGTTTATSGTSLTLAASASSDNFAYVGCWAAITDAVSGKHQVSVITAYNGTTKVATTRSWGTTPSTNSNYAIYPSSLGGISYGVWNASVNANTTSGTFGEFCGVGGVRVNSDGVTSIRHGIWDASRSSHANTGSFGQGVSSVQGDVTGSIGSLATQAKTDVNLQVVDVMNADPQAEPIGVPSANGSFREKIGWIFARMRNKQTLTKSSGVERIYADDSVTQIGSSTDTDDGATFTKGKVS